MTRFFAFMTGRYTRYIVVLLWLALAGAAAPLVGKLQETTKNDPATYLPGSSDAAKVVKQLRADFADGAITPALVIVHRTDAAPLGPADRAQINAAVTAINAAKYRKSLPASSPYSRQGQIANQVSPDGKAAFIVLPLTGDDANRDFIPVVDKLRTQMDDTLSKPLVANVTGPAGVSADAVEVFASIDGPLLLATVLLVVVLLLLTYRSPIIWLIPLLTVFSAYSVAAAITYKLASGGSMTITGQTTAILIVLMFGAGTDYCLLMVSRVREELKRVSSPREAVANASRATFPPVLSSGGTVVLAMLVLSAAKLDPTASMGPVLAIGVALTMLASFTLLPALLSIAGRRAFWPMVPRVGDHAEEENSGLWRKVGRMVQRHPVRTLIVGLLVLVAFGAGNMVTSQPLGFGDTNGFSKPTDSSRGFDVLKQHFDAGFLAQGDVVVRGTSAATTLPAAQAVATAIAADAAIAFTTPPMGSTDGTSAKFGFVLKRKPFGTRAQDDIKHLRTVARRAGDASNATVQIGGPTAQTLDTDTAVMSDQRRLIPAVLAVIFVVLVLLLRALVAPLHLIVSVVASFLATLGFTTWLFTSVLDHPGIDRGYGLFLFIFVVALGVDYNIFLISRIREEARTRGTVEGTVEGLARTGGVITSAGLVLAGTFAMLGTIKLYAIQHLGIGVAIGVLFDTFVVRSLLVPALMVMLGDRNWWPSSLSREDRGTGPNTDATPDQPVIDAPEPAGVS